ncbi:MAG TPA: hypothetical protein VHG89_04850 [Verrucomicrobiae bacterium]|nr:hypothetical protein [Verrucomicrobiae bacterium]
MAVKLETIQATVCGIVKNVAALKASATPANIDRYVFADDGTQREAIEDALKSIGWAVVVSPPIGAATPTQASATSSSPGGLTQFNVLTNVAVRTNPKKNTGANAVNVFIVVAQILQAAVDWQPAPSEKGFTLSPERPFEPDFTDEGCFTYDLRLMKTVLL